MDTNNHKIIEKILDDQKDIEEMSEKDLNLYGMVYHSLEKISDKGFTLGFSNNIIRKIEIKQQRQFNIKLYALISILLIMCLGFLFTFFSKDLLSILLSTILQYKYIVLFFIFMIISVQIASRFLIIKKLES